MFRSSTWIAWNFPAGGPKIPLRLFSNLPSNVSWVMLADLRGHDTVANGSHAIDARRLHQTRSWVVSLSILSRFEAFRGPEAPSRDA